MRARLQSRLCALLFAAVGLFATAPLAAAPDPLQPAGSGGVAELSRDLDRLGQHRRLMILGAHPDDEDDTLLAVASLGDGTEVAYLSLTRGEGGQNVIGDELGESLGVLRSEELLAGRRLDRGRQLFTRAYDFGYTESMAEGFARWPREELLVDVVRAIRRFRPQVVVAVFPPDERAGHGQHQVSGALADEAMRVAGDPAALPQLEAEGLAPWQPEAFFREAWRDPTTATVVLPSQRLDPLTGHTLFQLAMEVRSLHRSQSEGQLQALEGRPVNLRREAPPIEGEDALFAGVDTQLTSLARFLPAGPEADRLQELLADVEAATGEARRGLAPGQLGDAVAPLERALRGLREAAAVVAASLVTGADARHLAAFLAEKEEIAGEALAAALGLVIDATAERAEVVPGSELAVTVRALNGGATALSVRSLTLESPAGWTLPVPVALHPAPKPSEGAAPAPAGTSTGGVGAGAAAGLAGATTSATDTAATALAVPPSGANAGAGSPAAASAQPGAEGTASTSVATSGAESAVTAAGSAAVPAEPEPLAPPPPLEPVPEPTAPLASGALLSLPARITVDAAASPTAPYFLQRPRQGDLYDWENVPPAIRGEPFEPPPLLLRAELDLESDGGEPLALTLTREVVSISRSLSRGEVRRPLRAVPALEVSVARGLL
ncbi:MAG TPA: PIG-L family deacetylase, partial [Thermoanaerobaculia bacterium]|nr:PIG-L family deacetylase [Thermoanaerobaculia bacterium]